MTSKPFLSASQQECVRHLVTLLFPFLVTSLYDLYLGYRGWSFPGGSDSKESTCNAGDQDRSLGREDPLEDMATHCRILGLKSPMGRGASWAIVHGVTEWDMTEQLTLSFWVGMRNKDLFFPSSFLDVVLSV